MTETFASHITVCAQCGVEVRMLTGDENGRSVLRPCGHDAHLSIIPNPRLPK